MTAVTSIDDHELKIAVDRAPTNAVDVQEATAFEDFVASNWASLARFGARPSGSEETGKDLVQDALERTLRSWERIESRAELGPYVRTVMTRRNISLWRKFGREYPTATFFERAVEEPQRDRILWEAVLALPPRQRAVIALRYYEDMTAEDIARALGCARGTVKSQAARALAKLRRTLQTESVTER
jgi:RNA polymerase sigma-70 factor (sigma-E family)